MRTYLSMLIVALCFVLTGCFDITEEITLKRNGSGHYKVEMDMSSLFSNPFMEEAIKEEMAKEGGDVENMEMDSVVNFATMDNIPADLTAEERALLDRMTMRIKMSEEKKEMIISMDYPFDNFDQYTQMNELFERMQAREDEAEAEGQDFNNPFSMFGGLDDFNSSKSKFILGKKTLERQVILEEDDEAEEEMEEDAMAMMKMMFGDASFKTVYHLPGKVKKTTFPDAEVDGKTVTVNYDIIDMMEKKVDMSGSIKFK